MEKHAEIEGIHLKYQELDQAILKTIAYADIFDFPLKQGEILRYLLAVESSEEILAERLNHLVQVKARLANLGEYYMLPQRESIASIRQSRERVSQKLWPLAVRFGAMLAAFPYVRMVAVTGALAVNNPVDEDDLDYFVVTQPGRVWITRAFTLLLVRLQARRGITICPNYFISENALRLDPQNIYVAREISQMVPLSGRSLYDRLRSENAWTANLLPNASGSPGQMDISHSRQGAAGRLAERVLSGQAGDRLESWEMTRKIKKFRRIHEFSEETRFGPNCCQGHFGGYQAQTMETFQAKIRDFEQPVELERIR
jgi:hypothetical protein